MFLLVHPRTLVTYLRGSEDHPLPKPLGYIHVGLSLGMTSVHESAPSPFCPQPTAIPGYLLPGEQDVGQMLANLC